MSNQKHATIEVGAATIAAVDEARHLAAVRARGDLATPETAGKYRYRGTHPRGLRQEIERLRSDLSRVSHPQASRDDVLNPGGVLDVAAGDRLPSFEFYERLDEAEATNLRSAQDALRFRERLNPLLREEDLLASGKRDLARAQEAEAEARQKRESQEGIVERMAANRDREAERVAAFVAPFGDDGEVTLRAALSAIAGPTTGSNPGGASVAPGSSQTKEVPTRRVAGGGVAVVAQVGGAS
jgi:hypothetical protein